MVFKSSLHIQGAAGTVESVTGLNTDNTDPANPIVKISVDGSTITGQGTPASPLVSHDSGGTVTSISIASSNGFTGSSSGGAAPILTLATSITGVLLGNGTAISASNVTNDTQTKAAIVPNTAPSAGQILLGNAGGTAYAPTTVSGSGATISLASTGVVTISAIANASLSNSTISGIALGSNLAALTATDSTLTFSGSYIGATARTVGLNVNNTNTWSALQTFGNNISYGGAQLNVTSLASGNILQYNGTNWVNVAPSTFGVTSVTGTLNRITSTGGATPVIDISGSYIGQSSITTLGTIGTGTWQGTKVGALYGGTNLDTSASTGVAQVGAGAWSVSTALANGTTATTQTAGDNSTKVATTAYVSTAVGTPVTSITGTANQVIASASTGAVTLSLPQSIATSSAVQFGSLSLGTASQTNNSLLAISNAVTDPAGKTYGGYVSATQTLSSGNNANPINGFVAQGAVVGSSNNNTATIGASGLYGTVTASGSGNINGLAGVIGSANYTGTGLLTNAYNFYGDVGSTTSATATAAVRSEADTTTAAASAIINYPPSVSVGDAIIAVVCNASTSMATPSGWTLIGFGSGTSGATRYGYVFQKNTVTGSEAGGTFTLANTNANDLCAQVFAITNFSSQTVSAGAWTNGVTTVAAPSQTGVTNGLLLCCYFNANGCTPPAGLTNTAQLSSTSSSNAYLRCGYKSLASNAATGAQTATCSSSSAWGVSFIISPIISTVYNTSTFIGFYQPDTTLSSNVNAAFGSNMASGTGKYGLYMSGTAQHYLSAGLGVGNSGTLLGKLESRATSGAQIVSSYDASNYMTVTTGSAGSTTFALTGTTPTFGFSQAAQWTGGVSNGIGIGIANQSNQFISCFTSTLNNAATIGMYNQSAGGSAGCGMTFNNGTSNTYFLHNGTGVAASAYIRPSGAYFYNDANGPGLDFAALKSTGTLAFWTGGSAAANKRLEILGTGVFNLWDGASIAAGTTTGLTIGTATTQKLGFYNATPIVQPTGNIGTALVNLGLIASPTAPQIAAPIDLTGQTANKTATTLYAVPASGAGVYRITSLVVMTTAASVSSTLPNVQIVYTDNDTGGTVTIDATPILGIAGIGQTGALTANTVGTTSTGIIAINAKASTTIQYQTVNYASTAAGMAYALHIRIEAM